METGRANTVLVTGGRGFVGRAVGLLLQRAGYRVLSLDQSPAKSPAHGPTSIRDVQCDISDVVQLAHVFETEPIGGIIHLAAILPTAAQQEPVRATQVNVAGSLNLLEMARQFGVPRIVFGSSLSVYGTFDGDQVVSESCRAAPEDLYGAAKLYVESLGNAYRDHYGLEFVSLRIGRVVGPGSQSASSAWRSQIFELLGENCPSEVALPYVGSERVLLVHVDDVAAMLVTLLSAARLQQTVYNAPCGSVVVAELKREVEALNSNIHVTLGDRNAAGNPRLLDSSRYEREFNYQPEPIFTHLRRAAGT